MIDFACGYFCVNFVFFNNRVIIEDFLFTHFFSTFTQTSLKVVSRKFAMAIYTYYCSYRFLYVDFSNSKTLLMDFSYMYNK